MLILFLSLAAASPDYPAPMPDPGPRDPVIARAARCGASAIVPSSEWQLESRRRLATVTRFPAVAVHEGMAGTVVLGMKVDPSGAVSDIKIAATSSYPVLDQAALEAGQALTGLPPLPCAPDKGMYVRIPLRFVRQD